MVVAPSGWSSGGGGGNGSGRSIRVNGAAADRAEVGRRRGGVIAAGADVKAVLGGRQWMGGGSRRGATAGAGADGATESRSINMSDG